MSESPKKNPRFLVLRGGAIGDFMVTLPVLQALRARWPEAYIELIGYPHVAELARVAGLVHRVRSLDEAEMARFFSMRPVFTEEQAAFIRSFDIIISYLHDPDETVRLNFRSAGARLVVYGSPLIAEGCAAVDHLLQPLESLAIYERGAVPHLDLPSERLAFGREWRVRQGWTGRVVVLHPGSGSPKKNWPPDRFLALAERLQAEGSTVVLLLGEADEDIRRWLDQRGNTLPRLTGFTLVEVAAVLASVDGYIGNDSGITHLAAALGVPTLALFGPSDAVRWAPRGRRLRVVQAPGGQWDDLAVEQVAADFLKLLSG